ncbi:MAG: 2OG-Fe(II) oxygenase [Porphyrobacter sp.]|nr:2OG-Fe(II) oxygenase [Porphyrobacter sp.]
MGDEAAAFGKADIMNRTELADLIVARIEAERPDLERQFAESAGAIGHFVIDDLLPVDLADRIFRQFPRPETMKLKKTLREYKYIAAQMDDYDPLLEEAIYAFQDDRVVALVKDICLMRSAYPDVHLYAGGISMMGDQQFLNPHLDNSHDKDRDRWRVLNLLYYVTPAWSEENGGNLELWPSGVTGEPITIHSRFNRLAVMATHGGSWHSVSPIDADDFRCCVSNYYFSDEPLKDGDTFHVTSFRGRPEQRLRDFALRADAALRTGIRSVFAKGIKDTGHRYKREQ